MKNQKYFVDAWLEDPYFAGWLSKVKNDKNTIEISNGWFVHTDHDKGENHDDRIVKKKNFINRLMHNVPKWSDTL